MNRPVLESEFRLLEGRVGLLEINLKKLLAAVKRSAAKKTKKKAS